MIPSYGEDWVLDSLGRKWRDYKCELRREYLLKYRTAEALHANRPTFIPRDQWIGLVTTWTSEKSKVSNL